MGYSKLYSDILLSSVWSEPAATRLVWITMLALSDKNDEVMSSIPGLAHSAKVSIEECEIALECFLSPDKYSRTKANGGRRITQIDGGWFILNREKYRKREDDDEKRVKAAERQRRKRERDKCDMSRDVTNVTLENVTDSDKSRESRHVNVNVTSKGARSLRKVEDFLDVIESMEIDKEIEDLLSTWILAINAAGKFNPVSQEFEMSKLLGNGWSKDQLVAAIENSIGGPYPKFYDQSERNGAKPTKPAMTEEERKKARNKAKIRIVAHLNEGKPENEAIAAEIAREHDIDLPGFIELIRKQEALK